MMIMLIEDDATTAMALEAALSDAGHTIRGPASTARRALELAELLPPELALVDINLRDGYGSGIELARELHRRWGVQSIFVTGHPVAAHECQDIALGCIGKPFDPETVLAAINVAIVIQHGQTPPPGMIPHSLELFPPSETTLPGS